MKLFVGNLDYGITEGKLRDFFEQWGLTVESLAVIRDTQTVEPKGFAFVCIPDSQEAAGLAMSGKMLSGRVLKVHKAYIRETGRRTPQMDGREREYPD